MSYTQSRFQCPTCMGVVSEESGCCSTCGRVYATKDGILDFVGGHFDTQLDAASYDTSHSIDDSQSEIEYQRHRLLAGPRWPASLGSVIEIGCGTGMFSRAMIKHGSAKDAVLTDISLDMLRLCRGHLNWLDNMPSVSFATYSTRELCFQDLVFDTCVGTSVVHHIADVRAFLSAVWRFLKPGGRAFFVEPALRYHLVLAMTFSDIIAMIMSRDPTHTDGRQALHNWVAEARRGTMLQGDLTLLANYEDKHMFDGDAFERLALEAGFATAEALPSTPDPDGRSTIGGLLAGLQVGEPFASQVTNLWPSYANRYLRLLNAKDLSLGYLFWLTRLDQPSAVTSAPEKPIQLHPATEAEITGGGMPLRWVLHFTPRDTPAGLQLKVEGWCLANANIKSVRVAIDGFVHQVPVWLPRADVHIAMNTSGAYSTWNSLCCGVSQVVEFNGIRPVGPECTLDVDLVFSNNRFVPIVASSKFRTSDPFVTER